MPILEREVDIFPEALLEQAASCDENAQWTLLYTRARREKEAMRRFTALGVPFYSPLVGKRTRSPSGRVRKAYVPLFSSYIFIYGDEHVRYRALTTNCISRWLHVSDPARLIRDLQQIRRVIESGEPLTTEERLAEGARVRIRSGSLKGLEGTVIRRSGKDRLLVAVNFLAKGASFLLDNFQVEPIA